MIQTSLKNLNSEPYERVTFAYQIQHLALSPSLSRNYILCTKLEHGDKGFKTQKYNE